MISFTYCYIFTEHVRLELMTQKELLSDVRRSGFVSFEEIFDAQEMALEAQYSQMRYRGLALDDENVAQIQYQAKVITGSDNGLFQTDGRSHRFMIFFY